MDEVQSGAVTKTYTWGLELVAQTQPQPAPNASLVNYYVFDGHGSVRALTNSTGNLTDTYDYDAFGNLIHSTGTTPNNYLFASEQFDPDLALYYNRARYLNTSTGRFWSMDNFEGDPESPSSLHKYFYAGNDPVNAWDRSGNDFDLGSLFIAMSVNSVLAGSSSILFTGVMSGLMGGLPDAVGFGFFFALAGEEPASYGGVRNAGGIGGFEIVFEPRQQRWETEVWGGLEGVPVSLPITPGDPHIDTCPVIGRCHTEIGAFSAWYWNVSAGSNFFGLAGAAVAGNFLGVEQSGGSTAVLFGISNDTDLSFFNIGGGSLGTSGYMSKGLMTSEAVALEGFMTVLTLANAAKNVTAVNGAGGLAAVIINSGSVALWLNYAYGRQK